MAMQVQVHLFCRFKFMYFTKRCNLLTMVKMIIKNDDDSNKDEEPNVL